MMTAGMAIDAHSVRAVVVRGRRLVWHGEVAVPTIDALAAAIEECLTRMPRGRLGTARLSVALSPAFAQIKRISGLPPCKSRRDAANLIRRNMASLFVQPSGRSVLCGVHRARDGAVWAMVIDGRVFDCLTAATSRVRFTRVLPSVVVVNPAPGESSVTYPFDTLTAELRRAESELTELHIHTRSAHHVARLQVASELASLGHDSWRYASAYGATQTLRQPFVLNRPRAASSQTGAVRGWRLVLAGSAAALALSWSMLAPGLAGQMAARRYQNELAANAASRRDALIVERALQQGTGALQELMRYADERRLYVRLLAHLASTLPSGSALAALHVDSLEGNLVVLAERAASVVVALDRPGPIVTPRVIGPITQEVQGGTTVERATISFRLAPAMRESPATGLRS